MFFKYVFLFTVLFCRSTPCRIRRIHQQWHSGLHKRKSSGAKWTRSLVWSPRTSEGVWTPFTKIPRPSYDRTREWRLTTTFCVVITIFPFAASIHDHREFNSGSSETAHSCPRGAGSAVFKLAVSRYEAVTDLRVGPVQYSHWQISKLRSCKIIFFLRHVWTLLLVPALAKLIPVGLSIGFFWVVFLFHDDFQKG